MILEIDGHPFNAVFEENSSPKTCAAFRKALPFESQVVHVRWSGEAVRIPLGDRDFGVEYEDALCPVRSCCTQKGKARLKF